MYRMWIADDESKVCERMTGLLPWNEYGIEVAGSSSNGEQAWGVLESESIDLVLTDIRMPLMNGLELAERIHGKLPRIKVIMMSAYNDFSYAQAAIRFGVKGYLLKPVVKRELAELVRSVTDELRLDREAALSEDRDSVEAGLVRLLQGEPFDVTDPDRLPGGLSERNCKLYNRIVVCAFHSDDEQDWLYRARQLLRDASGDLRPLRLASVLQYGNRIVLFVLRASPIGKADLLQPLLALQNELNAHSPADGKGSDRMTFGVGNLHTGRQAIPVSYGEALYALGSRFFRGTDSVLFRQDVPDSQVPQSQAGIREGKLLQVAEDLVQAVVNNRRMDAGTYALAYLELMNDSQPEHVVGIRLRCMEVFFALDRIFKERNIGGRLIDKAEAMERIQEIGTLTELKLWFKRKMEAIAESTGQSLQTEGLNRYVLAAKQYAESHYPSKILVDDVAEHLHLNTKYFSSLFKKETGEGFIDYVNRIRIEKAAELILQSDARIFEVSSQVGFHNFPYFNRMFKRIIGVTPLVYRINRTKRR